VLWPPDLLGACTHAPRRSDCSYPDGSGFPVRCNTGLPPHPTTDGPPR